MWRRRWGGSCNGGRTITNRIAIALGLLILVAVLLDAVLQDWAGTIFAARKFMLLVDWVKFWR